MSSEATAWDFTIHSGQYRVRVVPEGRGYRARLISVGIGTIMEPHGRSPTEALTTLVRELHATDSAFERKLATDIVRHTALPSAGKGKVTHATKRAIPGVSKWDMTAGGTGAAEGKHGYTLTVAEGTYRIWPYTTKHGRHAGSSSPQRVASFRVEVTAVSGTTSAPTRARRRPRAQRPHTTPRASNDLGLRVTVPSQKLALPVSHT